MAICSDPGAGSGRKSMKQHEWQNDCSMYPWPG
jgi:hypothetical protein